MSLWKAEVAGHMCGGVARPAGSVVGGLPAGEHGVAAATTVSRRYNEQHPIEPAMVALGTVIAMLFGAVPCGSHGRALPGQAVPHRRWTA